MHKLCNTCRAPLARAIVNTVRDGVADDVSENRGAVFASGRLSHPKRFAGVHRPERKATDTPAALHACTRNCCCRDGWAFAHGDHRNDSDYGDRRTARSELDGPMRPCLCAGPRPNAQPTAESALALGFAFTRRLRNRRVGHQRGKPCSWAKPLPGRWADAGIANADACMRRGNEKCPQPRRCRPRPGWGRRNWVPEAEGLARLGAAIALGEWTATRFQTIAIAYTTGNSLIARRRVGHHQAGELHNVMRHCRDRQCAGALPGTKGAGDGA